MCKSSRMIYQNSEQGSSEQDAFAANVHSAGIEYVLFLQLNIKSNIYQTCTKKR